MFDVMTAENRGAPAAATLRSDFFSAQIEHVV
jgi:hypothetical protein